MFQHTAARRRLVVLTAQNNWQWMVSTHSRPKAAGCAFSPCRIRSCRFQHTAARRRLAPDLSFSFTRWSFNTQPPEGGWRGQRRFERRLYGFNTQPPEGGWLKHAPAQVRAAAVSTHSRPKAAGPIPEDA